MAVINSLTDSQWEELERNYNKFKLEVNINASYQVNMFMSKVAIGFSDILVVLISYFIVS